MSDSVKQAALAGNDTLCPETAPGYSLSENAVWSFCCGSHPSN